MSSGEPYAQDGPRGVGAISLTTSESQNFNDNDSGTLKVLRACDVCRRKKIRCDGARMPKNRCSNCIAYRFECTYVESAKKRGPPKGYVDGLENRLMKIELLLSKICTQDEVAKQSNETQLDAAAADAWPTVSVASSESAIRDSRSPLERASELDPDTRLKRPAVEPVKDHFFGTSSPAALIQSALELKKKYIESENLPSSSSSSQNVDAAQVTPSDLQPPQPQPFTFPEPDLMESLIDHYFANVNIFLPLLHRPTFERSVAEGQHLIDELFGETLLLVCSVGCLYSNDPRIFLEESLSTHSAGWKWFMQVEIVKKEMMKPPTVYALQSCALIALFLESSSAPQSSWTITGIGLRLAQDAGVHRKKSNRRPNIQDEIWKRAFWVLLCLDRTASVALGRPCAMQDEDFDADLPICCDDEYWEHPDPSRAFRQPSNKPSTIASFLCRLKLCEIAAFMLRTIYSNTASRPLLGFVGKEWEQHIVAELDSALNKWMDSVPDHLRWEPSPDNEVFYDQSVMLYATYYSLQISVHKPFIPSPRKPAPMIAFPSMAICTNAARACSHIVDLQKRRSRRPMPHLQVAAFSAATVLVMNIWGGKRSGINVDHTKEMVDVYRCMENLKICEDRWLCTGRTWDLLNEMARTGDLPMPQPDPVYNNKRERDSHEPISPPPEVILSSPAMAEGPRQMAGSRRAKEVASRLPPPTLHPTMSLPIYGEGRMPLISTVMSSGQMPSSLLTASGSNTWSANRSAGDVSAGYATNLGTDGAPGMFSLPSMYQDRLPAPFPRMSGPTPNPPVGVYSYRDARGLPMLSAPGARVNPDTETFHRPVNPFSVDSGMVQSGPLSMWSQPLAGFEPDEWGYLADMGELGQSSHSGVDSLSGQGW